ncbi:UNVERIFIED_CONTAM: hypothetical protein K2H54_018352 [Gekko kuhli]
MTLLVMAPVECEQMASAEDVSAAGDELPMPENQAPGRAELPEAAPVTAETEAHPIGSPPDSPQPASRLREQRRQDLTARWREPFMPATSHPDYALHPSPVPVSWFLLLIVRLPDLGFDDYAPALDSLAPRPRLWRLCSSFGLLSSSTLALMTTL